MTALDNLMVGAILLFLGLIIWTKVQNQKMSDTISELKEIVENLNKDE